VDVIGPVCSPRAAARQLFGLHKKYSAF
jgi:hypothetical protein